MIYVGPVSELGNNLRKLRRDAGITQQGMAERAGISRQAYAALESGGANPSTEVALRLSRALGRPVEDLFFLPQEPPGTVEAELAQSAGDGSGPPASGRARLFRVGERLFARPLRGANNARHSVSVAEGMIVSSAEVPGAGVSGAGVSGVADGDRVTVQPFDRDDLDLPSLAVLGCDPAVGLLEPELARRGVRLVAVEETSVQALAGLARGEAHVAGCHLLDDDTGAFNGAWVRRMAPFPCTLITFASWRQGLMVAPGNPKTIGGVERLADPDVSIVNRQPGSGSRALLDRLLRRGGIPSNEVTGYENEEFGHLAVAAAVASGRADTGVGVEAAALALGLDFVPLEDERYDFVVPDHLLGELPVQALLDALRRRALHRRVESLGGYDVSQMGIPAAG